MYCLPVIKRLWNKRLDLITFLSKIQNNEDNRVVKNYQLCIDFAIYRKSLKNKVRYGIIFQSFVANTIITNTKAICFILYILGREMLF
jgi:hypothetical protein